jgi:multiple sugar transport system permease protein
MMLRRWTRDGMYLLAVPAMLATGILLVAPTIVALAFAFTDYDGLSPPRAVGLANFRTLWRDPLFWTAVRNSTVIAVLSVPLRLALALALALLLAPARPWARTARVAAYLPSVIPDIAYALLWLWLLNPVYGPIGLAVQAAGLERHNLLLSPWGARRSIVLLSLFQIGEVYIVMLAARRELPGELYEVCVMEGVSAFWAFRNVTLPLLLPTIVFLAVRDVAWSFQSTFVPALVITKGGPNFATLVLPLYIYQNGFEYLRFGYASAMTVAMFVLTALLVGAHVAVLRMWGYRQSERLEPDRGVTADGARSDG